MSRNRMIHASFWESETIASWPLVTRLTYIALWNHSDDYGVVKADPTHLHSKCFPWPQDRYIDMKAALEPLIADGRLQLFKHNNKFYGLITNFSKRQTIQRPSKQRNPIFEEDSSIPHSALNEDRHFVPPAPHTGTVKFARSDPTVQQGSLTTKPLDSSALNEGLVSPHESLTLKEKLSEVKQPLPSVVVVNPREDKQLQQAKEVWEYYSSARRRAGIEHTEPFSSRRDDVLKTLSFDGVEVEDVKEAIAFLASNRKRRYAKNGDDLFSRPTTLFGKPGMDDLTRAARIHGLIADAKNVNSLPRVQQPQKKKPLSLQDRVANKQRAAKWLAWLDSNTATAFDLLHAGSLVNEAATKTQMKHWFNELEKNIKTGEGNWSLHSFMIEKFKPELVEEIENEEVKAPAHQARV